MKNALHVPDDWKTRWGPAIGAVKAHLEFEKYHEEHRRHCGMPESHKASFYEPLINTAKAVLDVTSRSTYNRISSEVRQSHRANDAKKPVEKEDPQWTNPLHLLGVKAYGSVICDGTNLPGLVVGGEPPTSPPCVWNAIIIKKHLSFSLIDTPPCFIRPSRNENLPFVRGHAKISSHLMRRIRKQRETRYTYTRAARLASLTDILEW